MKYFLEHNDKKYSNKDLIDAFYQLGIKRGDILCVHTELFNFGVPLLSRNEFLQTILNCFFEVIGKEGTLIMPTFTYSFCKNEVYDKINSKTKMGALNEYFRKQTGVKRTNDPIFSFAIKGAKEELFLKDTTSCFGENCVYEVLAKENGKYMTFGGQGHTLTHYAEEQFNVFYRYHKIFSGILIDENNISYNKTISYYVRKLDISSEPNLINIINIVNNTKNFKKNNFAGDHINIYNAKEYIEILWKKLDINQTILIENYDTIYSFSTFSRKWYAMEKQFYEILENILETKVDENTNLSMENCKNWTSLAHIDIIMSLEEEFEIKFNKEDLGLLKSQSALLEKIQTLKAEK